MFTFNIRSYNYLMELSWLVVLVILLNNIVIRIKKILAMVTLKRLYAKTTLLLFQKNIALVYPQYFIKAIFGKQNYWYYLKYYRLHRIYVNIVFCLLLLICFIFCYC